MLANYEACRLEPFQGVNRGLNINTKYLLMQLLKATVFCFTPFLSRPSKDLKLLLNLELKSVLHSLIRYMYRTAVHGRVSHSSTPTSQAPPVDLLQYDYSTSTSTKFNSG